MRLVPLIRRGWRLAGTACLCLAAAACAGSSSDSNPFAKASSVFTQPDWAGFTGPSKIKASGIVTSEDLITADGSCAGQQVVPVAAPEGSDAQGAASSDGTVGQAPRAATNTDAPAVPANDPLLQPTAGIALGMSECEVARRAGAPERVEMGADDRGERAVVLTYSRGDRAGIYRFREGRLFTIERVAVAEPEKPKKPVKPARAAKKPAPRQAAKPAPSAKGAATAWPAPPKQQPAAAQDTAWPAQPQPQPQNASQSQVWPSPPPLRTAKP